MKKYKKSILILSSALLATSINAQVIEDGTYSLVSQFSGDCLELDESKENIKAIQATCEDKDDQKFSINHINNDIYTISNLAVGLNSKSNGAYIYNSSTPAEFKIVKLESSYKIKSTNSNKYLVAKPYSNEIIQYHGNNSDEQLWNITSNINNDNEEDENQNNEITHNGFVYKEVVSPYTGKIWLDRNLGASQVCTSHNDTSCYGDYYQWGRDSDGHEKINSSESNTSSSDINGTSNTFITGWDWTNSDTNGKLRQEKWNKSDGSSVCPIGYRVPSEADFKAETITSSVPVYNNIDAYNSFLKLPSSGSRSYGGGSINYAGAISYLWTSTPGNGGSIHMGFYGNTSGSYTEPRGYGWAIRCIKN